MPRAETHWKRPEIQKIHAKTSIAKWMVKLTEMAKIYISIPHCTILVST